MLSGIKCRCTVSVGVRMYRVIVTVIALGVLAAVPCVQSVYANIFVDGDPCCKAYVDGLLNIIGQAAPADSSGGLTAILDTLYNSPHNHTIVCDYGLET